MWPQPIFISGGATPVSFLGTYDYELPLINSSSPKSWNYPVGVEPGDLIITQQFTSGITPSNYYLTGWPTGTAFFIVTWGTTTSFLPYKYSRAFCLAAWFVGQESGVTWTSNSGTNANIFGNSTVFKGVDPSIPIGHWMSLQSETGIGIRGGWVDEQVGTNPTQTTRQQQMLRQLARSSVKNQTYLSFYSYDPATLDQGLEGGDKIELWNSAGTDISADTNAVVIHDVLAPTLIPGDKTKLSTMVLREGIANVTRTNLLLESRNVGGASWTRHNIESVNPLYTPDFPYDYPTANVNDAHKPCLWYPVLTAPLVDWLPYFSQEVVLEQGKRYTLQVNDMHSSSGWGNFLGVDDGVNGWRRCTFTLSFPQGHQDVTPDVRVYKAADNSVRCAMSFVALVSGTHTITVGFAGQNYDPIERAAGFLMSGSFYTGAVSLVEGDIDPTWNPDFHPVTATNGQLTDPYIGDCLHMWSQRNTPDPSKGHRYDVQEIELCAAGTKPLPTVWTNGIAQERYTLSPDRLTTLHDIGIWSSGRIMGVFSTTVIPPAGFGVNPGKFYFEVTVGSLQVAQWALCIMLGDAENSRNSSDIFPPGDNRRQWTYNCGAGSVYYNTTTTAGLATATTPGDVVGVAIDRINHTITFYKNGVAVHTPADTTVWANDIMQAWLIPNTATPSLYPDQVLTANFKGPFSYPVVGFSPWQWW